MRFEKASGLLDMHIQPEVTQGRAAHAFAWRFIGSVGFCHAVGLRIDVGMGASGS